MKRYTVAQARARLSEVLDLAESVAPAVIERRGVRYVVRVERARARRGVCPSVIETIDPSIAAGEWTWAFDARGVRFRPRRRRP